LPLVGRTFVVLAGAFLLRAVTERGILAPAVGVAAGMAYAILWLVLAGSSAAKAKRTGATFHGIATAIIAFPLVWEATVKFEFLSPFAGILALLAVTGLGLAVAWRWSLRRLAWVMTASAASTALVLGVASRSLVLGVAFLLVLGFATLWMGWSRGWQGPGWLAAWVVDLSILMMTLMVLAGRSEQVIQLFHPESLVTLQLSLVLIYCGSVGARTLTNGPALRAGEIVQGAVALIVGLGGGLFVTRTTEVATARLGVVAFVLAVACYAVSFAFIDRRGEGRANFIFYTTLALFFTLASFDALLGAPMNTFAFSVIAVSAAWLGGVHSRATLSLHGAVYALVAAVTSGLLANGIDALVGTTVPSLGAIDFSVLVALVLGAGCTWFPVATHGRTWGRFSRVPKVAVLAVMAVGLGGLVIVLLAPLLPVAAEGQRDAAALAVLRTGVLAISVLLLAWIGHTDRLRETSWLVYPILIAGAAKLLVEDLPSGRASTLFLSLALYGGALILAPRLVRRASPASRTDTT
jgi:hypothetical protein